MPIFALRSSMGPQAGSRGPVLGLGISLLVHVAVLGWLMRAPALRAVDQAPVARIQVWLAPPRPPRPAAAEVPAMPESAPSTSRPAASRPQPAARSPRARPAVRPHAQSVPASSASASAAPGPVQDVAVAPSAPSTPVPAAGPAPAVDIAAARSTARLIAREEGRALVRLPKRKPVIDPNQDRQVDDPIENARRRDCTTAYAGLGILALIPLAKDAVTGTGCKW